jgi:hypothetical protein
MTTCAIQKRSSSNALEHSCDVEGTSQPHLLPMVIQLVGWLYSNIFLPSMKFFIPLNAPEIPIPNCSRSSEISRRVISTDC